ncbi:MAG: type III glutamate--ammonia ligase [Oceanospirillaceae bacterium]|uniref:type III glutamate--ammonia ligase n=1 Tax=unclassified Thalassolituus TaxID=2624967 RepID=UPI000C0A15E6|nr:MULTISPECIES: type III glutamate--ammonia ligase [unclassified Thalassolituus]MAK91363.1 type III glutamate--ammonia ligase [Thalassolituus sp.]MAS23812.1 type III glutamate--ammonia ligase [Oceanospirillaceae bacterium]MAY00846.1 type III glutamate--ammonia ligase [Oceanospirillaceae bacterium]MBL36668.1 type III glutamate--ammonia ligase [Oceanospirillaceae bacterium]MBS54452.1 type III glutamate--ammonia ligase [Oceanospirillaceae bacterium]|tara:strand:- start:1943 stop:3274 length:1332 start_codon:yes stop_codon:yes gene_type:complete
MASNPEQFITENGIKFVLAQFVDIHGVAKTKSVPAHCLMDVVNEGAGFAGFAVWGLGMEPHGPDFLARGDLDTLSVVPWQPGYARIACEGYVNGEPYPYDSRVVLKKQLARLADKGWTLNTGLEPEFSLFKRRPDGSLGPVDETDTLDKPCYDYKGLSRSREFLENLVDSLQKVGMDVYQIDHEDANGQFEINYTYSDALTSADRFTFVRMAAGEIANDLGMVCSFMPKPASDRTGNGMHFHLSIADKDGKNLFGDDSDKHGLGLSKMAYHFTAGLLHHAKALCAIAAPTVNSYKRLVVGGSASGATWAPAYICYGDNNRSAMVRIPYGRLEFRLPDSGCNPYLVHAALIAAGLDGIERELEPGDPMNINLYALTPEERAAKGIEILPQNLNEAIDALEADSILTESIGKEVMGEFIKLKRDEWVEYSRHVSDWEVARYGEFF